MVAWPLDVSCFVPSLTPTSDLDNDLIFHVLSLSLVRRMTLYQNYYIWSSVFENFASLDCFVPPSLYHFYSYLWPVVISLFALLKVVVLVYLPMQYLGYSNVPLTVELLFGSNFTFVNYIGKPFFPFSPHSTNGRNILLINVILN